MSPDRKSHLGQRLLGESPIWDEEKVPFWNNVSSGKVPFRTMKARVNNTKQNKIKPVDDLPSAHQDLRASPSQYLGNFISLCNVTTATRGWGLLALRRGNVHLDSHLRLMSVHDLHRERVVDDGSLSLRCLVRLIIGCLLCFFVVVFVVFVAAAASAAVFLLLFYVISVK